MSTTIESLITPLLHACNHLPELEVRELIERREEAAEPLLKLLRQAAENTPLAADPNYMGHIYAAMLLASFRERRAHKILLASMGGNDEKLIVHIWGDVLFEYMPRLLAMTADSNADDLIASAENENALFLSRGIAVEALACMVAHNELQRNIVVTLIQSLFGKPSSCKDMDFLSMLAAAAGDIHPAETLDLIEKHISAGHIDKTSISLDDLRKVASLPVDEVLKRTRESSSMRYFENAADELSRWICFDTEAMREKNEMRNTLNDFFNLP